MILVCRFKLVDKCNLELNFSPGIVWEKKNKFKILQRKHNILYVSVAVENLVPYTTGKITQGTILSCTA